MKVKHITAPYDPKRTIPQIVIRYSKSKEYIVVVRRNIEGVEGKRIIPVVTGDQIELKVSKEIGSYSVDNIYFAPYGQFENPKWEYNQMLFPVKGRNSLSIIGGNGWTLKIKFKVKDSQMDRWSRIPADAPFIVVAGSYGGFAGLGSSRKEYGLRRWLREATENGSFGGFREIPDLASWGAGCKLYESQQFVPFRQPFATEPWQDDSTFIAEYMLEHLDHDWSQQTLADIRHAEKLGFRMIVDVWDHIGLKNFAGRWDRNPLNDKNNTPGTEITAGQPFWQQEVLTDRNSPEDKFNYSIATRMDTIDKPWGPGAWKFGDLLKTATENIDNLIPRGHIRCTSCEPNNDGFERAVVKILHENGHRGPICINGDWLPYGYNTRYFTEPTLNWPDWKRIDLCRSHQAWSKKEIDSIYERYVPLWDKGWHGKVVLDDDGAATRPLRGYYEHNKFADIKMMHEVVDYARELFGDRLYAFVFKIALGPEFNADADYVLKGY